MSTVERLKCLERDIDKLVDRYSREAGRYKKTAFSLKITSVIFAALICLAKGYNHISSLPTLLRGTSVIRFY